VRHPRHHRSGHGPYAKGETTLAPGVLDTLDAGMLVLADRRFTGAALWRKARASGAALLWRVTTGTKTAPALPVDRVLADGSWLSPWTPIRWWAPRSWSGCWSTPSTILVGRKPAGRPTGW